MRLFERYSKRVGLFACALFIVGLGVSVNASGNPEGYSFKVHNKSSHTIKGLLASEDGSKYGRFDIGSGIPSGETVKLVWNKETDGQSCTQFFKAVFADGSESAPAKFDFCEEGVVLEFED